ncbi:hypothetical protein ACIA8O_38955 [Kitasatospora sp. NPDC051853]|uniref:hypothetical protein n=1 Tax=Kitasatospora sp. NPDC051853 TaxID=3364058 RepID=UPI0037B6A798
MPHLHYSRAAARTLNCLEHGRRADPARLRRVRRALERLAVDPRHPGLCSHRYQELPGHPAAVRAWTSYVDQGAGAWRLWWSWGPADGGHDQDQTVVTVLAIGPHR